MGWNVVLALSSGLNELNAGSVYVKVGPVLRVQAVLTGAAELGTQCVPRGN